VAVGHPVKVVRVVCLKSECQLNWCDCLADEMDKFFALPLVLCSGRLSIAGHVLDWLQVG
jgi:hypothetical protein